LRISKRNFSGRPRFYLTCWPVYPGFHRFKVARRGTPVGSSAGSLLVHLW
jgi:hypothetical protein